MQIISKILKIKTHAQPWNIFDTESENISYTIGGEDGREENAFAGDGMPEYLKLLCELKPVKNFDPAVSVSSTYLPKTATSKGAQKLVHKLYDGNMNSFVSAIEIHFNEILPEQEIPSKLSENCTQYFAEDSKIYTKNFITQTQNLNIKMTEDPRFDKNMYHHLISAAYPLAGFFRKGVTLENIEQHFFYIGTELQAKEYFTTISLRQLLAGNIPKLCPGLKSTDVTTLHDDVVSGKIELSFSDETQYKSIDIKKNTIISNLVVITFKKQ